MKKILFVFFSVSVSVFGQVAFNATYHNEAESAVNMTPVNGDYYCLTSNNSITQFGESRLYRYNQNGTLVFRKLFPVSEIVSSFMFPSLDNNLIVAGNMLTCDVPDSSKMRSFIYKVNSSGDPVFTYTVKLSYSNFIFDNFRAVFQSGDSSFYAFTDSVMFRVSKSGQLLQRSNLFINLGINSIKAAEPLPGGNILLSCKTGGQISFCKIDASGFFVMSAPAPALYKKLTHFSNGSFCAFDSQTLQKYSSTFQAGQTFTTSVKDVCIYNDTVYAISSNQNQLKYEVADSSFNICHSYLDLTGNTFPVCVKRTNGFTAIFSSGSTMPGMQTNWFLSLNVFPSMSGYNYNRDIGVSSVALDSLYSYATQQGISPILFTAGYKKATVYVRNFGTTPVSSFNLNYYEYMLNCGAQYFQYLYSGAPLNPGDSLAIITPSLVKSQYASGTSYTHQFCFYTTTPDLKNDILITNDGMCKSVNVMANGIKENDYYFFNIYPNPVEDVLSVFLVNNTENCAVGLFDALGREVFSEVSLTQSRIEINTLGLDRGLYYIRITTADGRSHIQKFIRS